MMQSEYSHSRNESVTTLNSDLPPLPCVRNQLVLSLDSHFVHVSTFSLISINLLMALATLLISILQSREVIQKSAELDMITTALTAFSVFFVAMFTAEVFFRMIMLGSFLANDHLVISDAIIVVISLASQVYFCIQRDKTLVMAASTLLVLRWPRILSRATFPQSNCRPMPGKNYDEKKTPNDQSKHLHAAVAQIRKFEQEREDMRVILNQQALQIKELTVALETYNIKVRGPVVPSSAASTVLFVNPE